MKKLFFSLLSLVMSMTMFAQSNVRKMNLIYDGQVVYSRAVSLIDSIKFVWSDGSGSGDDITGGEVDPSKQLYIGVVAFNDDIRPYPITSDIDAVKAFINKQTNDNDGTPFAYSVSLGNKMFDAENLPQFDKIFMLNFSDGTDNASNDKWDVNEGRWVPQPYVYDTAHYDLMQRVGLNSYAIGFGKDEGFGSKMKKVVFGSGEYYNAKSANDLQSTFNEIAQSMLASAKNVELQTIAGKYINGYYKYFRFFFTAEGGLNDIIHAKMSGSRETGYTLTIDSISNNYASFDAPAKGEVNLETNKVHIPLNNMKFVKNGEELQYRCDSIYVSYDAMLYYPDVEDGSTSENISKRIAVVLVLDCSKSMGDAFAPMKAAAVDFIKTMEKMEITTPDVDIPDVKVPTNEELWEDFKKYFNEYYALTRIDEPITDVATFWCPYIDPNANILTNFDSKYKWLGDYIAQVSAEYGRPIVDETLWRYSLSSFFNCTQRTVYPTTADFTEAGKPENWGPYYLSANDRNSYSHEYVDLGLSVKWATCNVGATKPEEYGDYFAWGETQPKSTYDWSTYKYCNGSSSSQTKYCTNSSYGTVDNKTTLEAADDAARSNWGGSWRMPTKAEQDELRENCTWTWTTQNGVNGYKVTSKLNGNSIFLPAAGYRYDSSLKQAGSYGDYWSSSLNTGDPSFAFELYFHSDNVIRSNSYRYCGQSVRPVCP